MASRQFKSTDTVRWAEAFGSGADSSLTISGDVVDTPIDSTCTGTVDSYSLSATNANFVGGQIIMIHQTKGTGAGNWELNKISTYSAGTITTSYKLCNTYASGAQVLVLKQYSSITINSGKYLYSKVWNGSTGGILGLMCNGTTTINGNLYTASEGFRGAAGTSSNTQGSSGESQLGAGSRTSSANGISGGGADGISTGNPYCGDGGSGGHANYGTSDSHSGGYAGAGGSSIGNSDLTTLYFGGSGGSGGSVHDNNTGGAGGTSGGVILLITYNLVNNNSINADGGWGGDRGAGGAGGGGGGAAGGSILIKSKTATLGTTNSNGGYGGISGYVYSSTRAPTGSAGRIHLDYSASYTTGTSSPAITVTQDATIDYLPSAEQGYSFIM